MSHEGRAFGPQNPRDELETGCGLDLRDMFDHFSDYRRSGPPKCRGGWRKTLFLVLTFVCTVTALLLVVDHWASYGRIHRGVGVGSVDVGGKTPVEVRCVIEDRAACVPERVRLFRGSGEFAYTADELGTDFEMETSLDQAYAVGRKGDTFERLGDRSKASWRGARVQPVLGLNREQLLDALSDMIFTFTFRSVEAAYEVENSRVFVNESRIGKKVDEEALLSDVEPGLF
ncbi:MAG TPA: peptidoglycan binding domain-containing protein [Rubrobacteraceae bacterium]|nr:peptidoglycan binding domain-containing protein [Rubrobacteraceae bacterium]